MLYAVACADWSPGSPLTPAMTRARLFRTRAEPANIAPGHPILAVAARYDSTRGEVIAQKPAARGLDGPWSAPAILDGTGGLTVLAPIPAALVRELGPSKIRVHPGTLGSMPGPHDVSSLPRRPSRVRWRASRNRVRVLPFDREQPRARVVDFSCPIKIIRSER